jgi:C4-type Zn-finger protein
MIPDERMAVEARLEETDLDRAIYMEEGGSIGLYDEDGDELASMSYDDETFTSLREAAIEAVDGDEEAAAAVRENLEEGDIYLEMDAPPESVSIEDEGLEEYMAAGRVRDELSDEAMDHEYDTAMCHQCHDELDVIEADPEREGLKVKMYSCDGCGYHDHEFVEEGLVEDGAVTVSTIIDDDDDLRRFVDIREGAGYKLIDGDVLEDNADSFAIEAGLEREDDLDRYIAADAGTEVTVYGIDRKHREELASVSFDGEAATTPREVLMEGVDEGPEAFEEVREYVEDLETGSYAMVEVKGRQGTGVAMHTEGLDEVERKDPEDIATIYSKSASAPTQVPVEGLLTQLTDRHTMLRDETRETVSQHREDPNFELRIEDPSGGSDIEHEDDDQYLKMVEETDIRLGSMGGQVT